MIVGGSPLLPVLDGSGVEVEAVVDVDLGPGGDPPDDPDHLVVLVADPHGVGVAAVVEEGHGGEDGPAHWNDVELGDVVVLEDTLCHLQPVGSHNLKVAEQQGRYENLGTVLLIFFSYEQIKCTKSFFPFDMTAC